MTLQRSFAFKKIAILGLGLIGGSIAKGIKKQAPLTRIATIQRQDADVHRALDCEVIDEVFIDLAALVQTVDLVILATPLSVVIPIAQDLAKLAGDRQQPLVVMDVGSVKRKIASVFEQLSTEKIEFISTHPMAGSEKHGFAASCETLFRDCTWIITAHTNNTGIALQAVKSLLMLLEAHCFDMSAEEHDRQVAVISHLPYVLARNFLDFVTEHNPEALKIAGPGFKSFTRLAHDHKELRREIFDQNQDMIQTYLAQWLKGFLAQRELT